MYALGVRELAAPSYSGHMFPSRFVNGVTWR